MSLYSLVICCILWFVKSSNLADLYFRISNHFNVSVNDLRKLEKCILKVKKLQLDITYFNDCDILHLCPKFLLTKPKLKPISDDVDEFNKLAITSHIKFLNKKLKHNKFKLQKLTSHISSQLSWFRILTLKLAIYKHVNNSLLQVKESHRSKLSKLWLEQRTATPDCIINLSSHSLSLFEREALRYGLKNPIAPRHLDLDKMKYELEKSICGVPRNDPNWTKEIKLDIIHSLKEFEDNCNDTLKSKRNRMLHMTLNRLSKIRNLKICSFDKGQGIVLVDTDDYNHKLNGILSDSSKFKIIPVPNDIKKHPVCIEENKLSRYLNKYVKNKVDDSVYKDILPSGSNIARIYGTVKVHKNNYPVRPIVSTIGAANYKLAKYLDNLIKPHINDDLMLKSTNDFISVLDDVKHKINRHSTLVSFDVENLFTNVPVTEAINIATKLVYSPSNANKPKYEEKVFKDLLKFATSGCFLMNDTVYQQVDGVSMGSPLGPTLANVFLANLEHKWQDLPFSPVVYRRYVDDIIAVFNNEQHIDVFHNFLNIQHSNLHFTSEVGNKELPFLDVLLKIDEDNILTEIYRKPTFTGLLLNFNALCPRNWKNTLVLGMLHRAYNVSTNWNLFHNECSKITNILSRNGYPLQLIQSTINKFIGRKLNNSSRVTIDNDFNKIIKIPFVGYASQKFSNKLVKIFRKLNLECKVVMTSFKTGRYFSLKSKLGPDMQSRLVYCFQCQVDPDCQYIGKTKRRLHQRKLEHLSGNSAIAKHIEQCNHCFRNYNDCFKIIYRGNSDFEISIVESIKIFSSNPLLNRTLGYNGSSYFLKIFN